MSYNDFEMDLLEEVNLNITLNEEEIVEESNIDSTDIGAPKKQGKSRFIMITGSGDSSHNGRMKVSKPGVRISRKTSHDDYISIYRKSKDIIKYDGDLKKIEMNSKEYNFYKDLFIRNEELIKLVKSGNGTYDNYVDDALIKDEQLRAEGKKVNRDNEGNVSIYDKDDNLLYRNNIKGETIK